MATILPFRRPEPHDDPFRLFWSYYLDNCRVGFRMWFWWVVP